MCRWHTHTTIRKKKNVGSRVAKHTCVCAARGSVPLHFCSCTVRHGQGSIPVTTTLSKHYKGELPSRKFAATTTYSSSSSSSGARWNFLVFGCVPIKVPTHSWPEKVCPSCIRTSTILSVGLFLCSFRFFVSSVLSSIFTLVQKGDHGSPPTII